MKLQHLHENIYNRNIIIYYDNRPLARLRDIIQSQQVPNTITYPEGIKIDITQQPANNHDIPRVNQGRDLWTPVPSKLTPGHGLLITNAYRNDNKIGQIVDELPYPELLAKAVQITKASEPEIQALIERGIPIIGFNLDDIPPELHIEIGWTINARPE